MTRWITAGDTGVIDGGADDDQLELLGQLWLDRDPSAALDAEAPPPSSPQATTPTPPPSPASPTSRSGAPRGPSAAPRPTTSCRCSTIAWTPRVWAVTTTCSGATEPTCSTAARAPTKAGEAVAGTPASTPKPATAPDTRGTPPHPRRPRRQPPGDVTRAGLTSHAGVALAEPPDPVRRALTDEAWRVFEDPGRAVMVRRAVPGRCGPPWRRHGAGPIRGARPGTR